MTDLRSLIERLEKLEGPCREVDALLHCFASYRRLPSYEGNDLVFRGEPGEPRNWLLGRVRNGSFEDAFMKPVLPGYTASLDAAIALCERVLPGFAYTVSDGDDHGAWAAVWRPGRQESPAFMAATPAIALVLATLRALEGQGGAE